jgi:hypothetical protein
MFMLREHAPHPAATYVENLKPTKRYQRDGY